MMYQPYKASDWNANADDSGGGLFEFFFKAFVAVVIIIGILAVSGGLKTPDTTVSEATTSSGYSSIPLSEHAKTAHQGEKWNSETIARHFDDNGCKPNIDTCNGQEYHWCFLDDGGKHAIGLVIGVIIEGVEQIIITGFQGGGNYWSGQCD